MDKALEYLERADTALNFARMNLTPSTYDPQAATAWIESADTWTRLAAEALSASPAPAPSWAELMEVPC